MHDPPAGSVGTDPVDDDQERTWPEMNAEFLLLGHAKPDDDPESQAFAEEVRELNPNWQPGQRPVVPARYQRNISAVRRQSTRPTPIRSRRGTSRAPRSVAARRSRKTTASSARSPGRSTSSDDPDGEQPSLLDDLNQRRNEALLGAAVRVSLGDPASSPLWTLAPWGLRHEYADGYIDAQTFWAKLGRWLEVSS